MIPQNIKREHILQAIQEIKNSSIPPQRESVNYDLFFEEKRYPPKYVISIANKYANDQELESKQFDAIEAKTFLPRLGFEVKLKYDIKPGDVIGNQQISTLFGCGTQGGMRKSNRTNTLVVISDNTKPYYKDEWKEGILQYTGMGLTGDQNIEYKQNKTLAESQTNGIEVHLFEVNTPGQYIYKGEAELAGKPYEQIQNDSEGNPRKAIIFPLKVKQTKEQEAPSSIHYWQIAPGPGAKDWDYCKQNGIIPIYFEDYLKDLSPEILTYSQDQLWEFCRKYHPNPTFNSIQMIWAFLHEVNEGDYILVNKGKKIALGWGIIKSPPKIFSGEQTFTFYREVDWQETELNRDLDYEQGKNFFITIQPISKELFESIVFPKMKENPQFRVFKQLLDKKKQIILYGPPGTGKTYLAGNFIANESHGDYIKKSEKFLETTFYAITTVANRDGPIPSLKVNEAFVYQWDDHRNYQKYYEMMEIGDFVLCYHADDHKITSIAKCSKKDEKSLEFTIVAQIDGPSYSEMKEDPVLKESSLIYSRWTFSIRLLKSEELESIFSLIKNFDTESINIQKFSEQESIKNSKFVTFHPSFGYEEFIEGLRPITDYDGQLRYVIQDGIFKKFCRDAFNILMDKAGIQKEWSEFGGVPSLNEEDASRALEQSDEVPFYLVIDEINRGDISRIFGELITLLEADKRLFCEHEFITELPYSKQNFGIPPNLFIIGTMNTADKSIALVDVALRRRFGFYELLPNYNVLNSNLVSEKGDIQGLFTIAIQLLESINQKIIDLYDRDHQIGHSYLIKLKDSLSREEAIQGLKFIWYYEILPLLQEYFYDSPNKLQEIIGEKFIIVTENENSFQFTPQLDDQAFIVAIEEIVE